MKKFVFNSVKAANLAKTANVAEKQQDANAKTLLTVANNPPSCVDQNSLADISKPSAGEISGEINNVSSVRNVSNGVTQKLKIEPMKRCLHGERCSNLHAPGEQRPVCGVNGEPVFDLKKCPNGKWL